MTAHSPRPWLCPGNIGFGRLITSAAASAPIAVVYSRGVNPESDANVALIAAAPELLYALTLFVAGEGLSEERADHVCRSCKAVPRSEPHADNCAVTFGRRALAKARAS